jgi:hypothetical protein
LLNQHLFAGPGDDAFQFAEAERPVPEFLQDYRFPLAADRLERRADAAEEIFVFLIQADTPFGR